MLPNKGVHNHPPFLGSDVLTGISRGFCIIVEDNHNMVSSYILHNTGHILGSTNSNINTRVFQATSE